MSAITETKRGKENIISLRHYGSYETVHETWGKLAQVVLGSGVASANLRPIGITYDNPNLVPTDKLRYDAAFVLDAESHAKLTSASHGRSNVRVESLPEVKAMTITHKGSYRHLRNAYADLTLQLGLRGGHDCGTVFIEEYKNNPLATSEEDLVTEVSACIK
jgi:AraC family transcriptional regulator